MRHRARELMVGQRTAALNALRGHLSEIGVVAAQGVSNATPSSGWSATASTTTARSWFPTVCASPSLLSSGRLTRSTKPSRRRLTRELEASTKADETARPADDHSRDRPGHRHGASRHDPGLRRIFQRTGVRRLPRADPREHSSGGKPRLGRITKMGDRYLRKLLVVGACSALAARKGHNDALRRWASREVFERKTVKYKFKLTRGGARQQAGADRPCARDQRGQLRQESTNRSRPERTGSARRSFRRKAIRIEGDGEAM